MYMSPDPYHKALEEVLDLRCLDFARHWIAGLCLAQGNGQLSLAAWPLAHWRLKYLIGGPASKAPGSSKLAKRVSTIE